MINYLEGTVVDHEGDVITVAAGGIGYGVHVTRPTVEVGDRVKFFITEVIREDKFDLYGFPTKDEKALFGLLIDVQGVGPRMAQKILSAASPEALRGHIEKGDLAFFTSISGVGKKTAQKIILDLKGIIVTEGLKHELSDDVTDALQSLGYSYFDIKEVLPHVIGATPEERVKSALQLIGKRK